MERKSYYLQAALLFSFWIRLYYIWFYKRYFLFVCIYVCVFCIVLVYFCLFVYVCVCVGLSKWRKGYKFTKNVINPIFIIYLQPEKIK